MEKFQEVRDKAKKNIQIADHMLSITYPLVKDTKLLLAIIENVFLAYTHSMSSVLYYDRLFKRIPHFQDNFESKFNIFKEISASKYGVDADHLKHIQEIKEIIVEHKKSPIEFVRKDRFVICSDNYRMKSIGVEEIKNYITKAKLFIQEMDNITKKNEGIFR